MSYVEAGISIYGYSWPEESNWRNEPKCTWPEEGFPDRISSLGLRLSQSIQNTHSLNHLNARVLTFSDTPVLV